jgi:alpha-galactosidase/6-phospho-beta-glucosidase family protein
MKIAVIGGGSYCWTPTLFRDIVCTPGMEGAEIVLEDINKKHLGDLYKCCQVILQQVGKANDFKLSATTNEAEALKKANYVLLTITTGAYDSMENDLVIPYKYGIYQPVGDTVGPGGISRALRNIPVVVGIAKNMERYCPNAWMLNITNPMSTLTRCVWKYTDARCIGLCHELYGALGMLQKLLGANDWRKDFDCISVGVNHLPWIIKLHYQGKDAFPIIRKRLHEVEAAAAKAKGPGTALDETLVGRNQIKFALFEAYNALPAAGDRHIVEFFPYFCTKEMKKGAALGVALTLIEDRRNKWTPRWIQNVADITTGKKIISKEVSGESTSKVIAALEGQIEWKDVLNLPNQGQVRELPKDYLVETMGLIMRDAVYGLPVGTVPPPILSIIRRHAENQEMTVEAAMTGDRDLVHQIMLNDPMCGSIRDFRQMRTMMEELLTANRKWLPNFFKK